MTTPLVRAADIAAIANVSRAAVTQWRKRHKDFPAPKEAAGSDSPLFDRTEVEQWLANRKPANRNRAAATLTPKVLARRISDHLRGISGTQEGIDLAGAGLVAEYLTRALSTGAELEGFAEALGTDTHTADEQQPSILTQIDGYELGEGLKFLGSVSPKLSLALAPLDPLRKEIIEFLCTLRESVKDLQLDEFLGVYDTLIRDYHRGNVTDPAELSQFLIDLAAPALDTGTVLDPAAGVGFTLLSIGENRNLTLVGVDIDEATHATAVRRAILANRAVDLRVGNSLGDDPAAGVLADAVISTPPWGMRDFGPDIDPHSPRWVFGRPSPRSDGIWLQQAIEHLADGGRAFIVTTRSELSRSGPSETLRHELLRQGTIEAIIALPPSIFAPYTPIATAVWVLARPGQTVDPDQVLLVDIPSSGGPLMADTFSAALAEYEWWRTTGERRNTAQSLVVPVRDLLEPKTGLAPETWIQRRDAPNPQEMIEQIIAAHAALADTAAAPTDVTIPDLVPTGVVRREQLTALPGVTLVRSRPTHQYVDADKKTGAPLLTGKILHDYLISGAAEPGHYVATADLPAEIITRPGDIVVIGITRVGNPVAMRVDLPGWVISSQNFLVRVDPNISGAPDPDYLVACINATAHTHTRLKDSVRIMPSHIEIPIIAPAEQHRIAGLIRALTDATTATAQHLARLRELSALVKTATGTGAVTIKP